MKENAFKRLAFTIFPTGHSCSREFAPHPQGPMLSKRYKGATTTYDCEMASLHTL